MIAAHADMMPLAREVAQAADCTEIQALFAMILAGDDYMEASGGVEFTNVPAPYNRPPLLDINILVPDPAERVHVARARTIARPLVEAHIAQRRSTS